MNYKKYLFSDYFNPVFIVFFRVAIGLIVMMHFISYWKDFELLYTNESIVPLELHSLISSYRVIKINDILLLLDNVFGDETILAFKALYIFFAFLIIIGLFSRISALILIFFSTQCPANLWRSWWKPLGCNPREERYFLNLYCRVRGSKGFPRRPKNQESPSRLRLSSFSRSLNASGTGRMRQE